MRPNQVTTEHFIQSVMDRMAFLSETYQPRIVVTRARVRSHPAVPEKINGFPVSQHPGVYTDDVCMDVLIGESKISLSFTRRHNEATMITMNETEGWSGGRYRYKRRGLHLDQGVVDEFLRQKVDMELERQQKARELKHDVTVAGHVLKGALDFNPEIRVVGSERLEIELSSGAATRGWTDEIKVTIRQRGDQWSAEVLIEEATRASLNAALALMDLGVTVSMGSSAIVGAHVGDLDGMIALLSMLHVCTTQHAVKQEEAA